MLSNKDKMENLLNWIDTNMNISEHGLMLSKVIVQQKKESRKIYFDKMLNYHRELCK